MTRCMIRSGGARAVAGAALALGAAACGGRSSRADAAGSGDATRHDTSAGEVARTWTPQTVTSVRGVSAEALRSAIDRRLAGARPANLNDDHWKHAQRLYKRFARGPLWLDANGLITDRTAAMLRALLDANTDALRVDWYPIAELARAVSAVRGAQTPSAEELAEADVLLTASFAALGEDLLVGEIEPKSVSQDWHINPMEEHIDSALVRSLTDEPLDRSILKLRPSDPDYDALRQALQRYRQLVARGGWRPVPAGPALKPGFSDSPARLAALRARLAAEGFLSDTMLATSAQATQSQAAAAVPQDEADSSAGPATAARRPTRARHGRSHLAAPQRAAATGPSIYDRSLAGAIAQFQARHGIVVDSMLGQETLDALNIPAQFRLQQIAANLERYRWMPRTLGSRYVLVNVPAFHLQAFDSGQKSLDMKVIVGAQYANRNTPVFSDSMETVVFRPYWNVTDSIAAKEIWPKANADPGYMERHHYETYQEGGKTRIRQLPGAENSLGLVKFLFPNRFDVYLHDTPADSLFKKDVRAFSHGCIRLEKPGEFAQWVLGWPADKVQQAMNAGADNHSVPVKPKIPVYIAYFTTYMNDGQLFFGNDLYRRDNELAPKMAEAATPSAAALQTLDQLRKVVEG